DIGARTGRRACMEFRMPEFVRNQQRTGCRIGLLLAADRSALVIEYSPCALQRGITARQENEIQLAPCHGRLDQAKRVEGILPFRDQLLMERRSPRTDWLERIHRLRAPTATVAAPH